MWANVSHWKIRPDRVDEQLVRDALDDASRVVSREHGFLRFYSIRTGLDTLIVVTLWASEESAHRAAALTPTVREFYAEYVASAEITSGEVVLDRGPEANEPA